jgi:hypothetical protein
MKPWVELLPSIGGSVGNGMSRGRSPIGTDPARGPLARWLRGAAGRFILSPDRLRGAAGRFILSPDRLGGAAGRFILSPDRLGGAAGRFILSPDRLGGRRARVNAWPRATATLLGQTPRDWTIRLLVAAETTPCSWRRRKLSASDAAAGQPSSAMRCAARSAHD